MQRSVFDAVVIGAGPAGAAAARLLASWGHAVAVIGRAPRHPPLAESLPPSCARLFDQLGVRAAVDGAGFVRATGNTVQWADHGRRVELFDAGARGYQVPRDKFDALLSNIARVAGATVHGDATVRDVERGDDGVWSVEYETPAGRGREALHAHWVLDCSGRSGVVARRGWRSPETSARTTAVVGVWDSTAPWPLEDDTHTLVESYSGGWAWSVPVSASRRYVTVMLDPSITALPGRARLGGAYHTELGRTASLKALVARATLVGAPWACDASPYSADQVYAERILLVGDAASFVDPLSSFGVKKALASAWLAAVAVHTAQTDPAMTSPALELFAQRECAMYDHLQRQSAALAREAAGAHESGFWLGRADAAFDGAADDARDELDVAALRSDRRVLAAFEELKRRPAVNLRASDALRVIERATVRGHRVVLEEHLVAPAWPGGVRYCRNIDLVLITQLAGRFDQVPDLFDAYNRAAPHAPLPDFLGALSALVGLEILAFA